MGNYELSGLTPKITFWPPSPLLFSVYWSSIEYDDNDDASGLWIETVSL